MAWTTTELLATIRRRAKLADSDPDYTDANLLLDADDQMDETIVPLVLSVRGDYYVTSEDQAITAGEGLYPIPSAAVASVLRQVYIVDSGGETRPIPFLPLMDRHTFQSTGEPRAYTIQDDQVLLLPTPATTRDTLRMEYEARPSKLLPAASCALATAIDTALGGITCATVPASWSGSTIVDIVKGSSPFTLIGSGFDPIGVVTGALGEVSITPAQLPDRFAVGDYICPTGYTCLPQIPADLHPVLALAVACEVLDQQGDPGAQAMRGKLAAAMVAARRKLSPRVKGSPQKIVSRNSALRGRRGRRWSASLQ